MKHFSDDQFNQSILLQILHCKKNKNKQTTEPLEILFLYNHWNIPSLAVERFKTQKETIF